MPFRISAGVITCNEEQTIGPLLKRLIDEADPEFELSEIIVVSAECRDQTDAIVRRFAERDRRVRLIAEKKRRGKSAAVNTFLAARKSSDLTLLTSGDVLPKPGFLAKFAKAFDQPGIGMAGGRPIPVNGTSSFTGRMAALMWELHHQVALKSPKLGETIIFRSEPVPSIDEASPVDEASIEGLILAKGLSLRYVPDAIIQNRGPDNFTEWFSQRRRIAYGHGWLKAKEGHHVSTGSPGAIIPLLLGHLLRQPSALPTAASLVFCEALARAQAGRDLRKGKDSYRVWDLAKSTKNFSR